MTDLDYAEFAQLYDLTSFCETANAQEVMARYLNVPKTTIAERVREAKRRGLLTVPGQAIRYQTFMTDKAKEILNANPRRKDNNN